ncbi:MAG: acyltransferase family protein, partial [Ruminococcus sp.]|nr:acyltransferase family protein [Ruminococcus sp.]
MNLEKLQKRDSSLDIVRIVAVFTVLSVHFFLHNGFYSQPVNDVPMYIMVTMRTLFSICVPMFMMLTGYLMCNKKLSKSYYKGISKTLVVFVLITIVCMIYKSIHNFEVYRWQDYIFDTLDFTGANYSWYIEMYIGLFLIAPFLNAGYHKLETRGKRLALVWTMIVLTVIPTLLNNFNFENLDWWGTPTISDEFAKLFPAWWGGLYPITFYFTGSYVREYGIKLKTKPMLVLLVISLFLFSSFNFYRSYNMGFKSGTYVYWSGFEPYVLTVLIFTLLTRIK